MAKTQVSRIPVHTLEQGLAALCGTAKTQSGQHIKPFHLHCSNRLVIEGGFPPEWVRPRPPLSSKQGVHNRYGLSYSRDAEDRTEQVVLGAMKYKNVDVTVVIPGVGPTLGISVKSTGNAFRNLTNRMEEAPGDCVNIHMMYPGFVFGFLHLIKFAQATEVASPNDASFDVQGRPLESIIRYHNALCALTGRATITDPAMRYEAVGLLVYRCLAGKTEVLATYPSPESPIHFSRFFQKLYEIYDLRYAYPDASGKNHRKVWDVPKSTLSEKFDAATGCAWDARLGTGEEL
jgi:hypothetical protein